MRGLKPAEEACASAAGVVREGVSAGEHGSPSDGREVGCARGGEGVGQGEPVVPAGAGEDAAADRSA